MLRLIKERWDSKIVLILVAFLVFSSLAYAQISPNYRIESDVNSGGGGQGGSTNYELSHIIGQPSAIGVSSSTHYINYAGFLSWGEPSPITPPQGTLGTEIRISGSNFGTKKGKILVGSSVLKVLEWNNELIHAQITKPIDPGTYDVTIQPVEPKGAPPITEKGGFTVSPPEIRLIEQGKGSSYDQVTIRGKFFGTKKGKVYLEYDEEGSPVSKSCKVTKWWMDPVTNESEIFFTVPKMLPEVCDVVVVPASPLPEADEEDGFIVKAPEIISVDPGQGSVNGQITISGNFFGLKTPKVYLGYLSKGKPTKKSCSVVSWTDESIVFTIPALPGGNYDVMVTNSVGSAQYGQKLNIK